MGGATGCVRSGAGITPVATARLLPAVATAVTAVSACLARRRGCAALAQSRDVLVTGCAEAVRLVGAPFPGRWVGCLLRPLSLGRPHAAAVGSPPAHGTPRAARRSATHQLTRLRTRLLDSRRPDGLPAANARRGSEKPSGRPTLPSATALGLESQRPAGPYGSWSCRHLVGSRGAPRQRRAGYVTRPRGFDDLTPAPAGRLAA